MLEVRVGGTMRRVLVWVWAVVLLTGCGGGGAAAPAVQPLDATSASYFSALGSAVNACVRTGSVTGTTTGGVRRFVVAPADMSSCTHTLVDASRVWRPTADAGTRLAVLLPGTASITLWMSDMAEVGAARGYRVIALAYPNARAIFDLCRSAGAACAGAARSDIVFGGSSSGVVNVAAPESISGQLLTLLKYMTTADPDGGWQQFYDSADRLQWDRIAVSGVSQGAGHAALIAKTYAVRSVAMYAGPSDWVFGAGTYPSWYAQPSATPPSAYGAFGHLNDSTANSSGNPDQLLSAWRRLIPTDAAVQMVQGATETPLTASRLYMTNDCAGLASNEVHTCVMRTGYAWVWRRISFGD